VIGAKTLALLALAAVGALSAWQLGLLVPDRLLARDPAALVFAGAFGAVVGSFLFRFFRLGERSKTYFRWSRDIATWENEAHFLGGERSRITLGQNEGRAFDLGPRMQLCVCVTLGALLGIACIDARSLALLARFQHTFGAASSSYCPEVEMVRHDNDPNAPGCALIRRAYALGYAKELGECAASEARAAEKVCTLRQRDEPLLHYAYRLLEGFAKNASSALSFDSFRKMRRDFDARVAHLETIRGAQRQVLSSAPHAVHQVWTSLAEPPGGAFREQSCADRYRLLPHHPPPQSSASQVFEHVVAQLLFESRYQPAAGYCREYAVHWNAPEDACRALAADPEGFLARANALAAVRAAIDRWRLGKQLEALGKGASQRALEAQQFLSFQCYVERSGAKGVERTSLPFQLDGFALSAEEVIVPALDAEAKLYIDRYEAVATMFVRGFHYGVLLSEGGYTEARAPEIEATLGGAEFPLSRLFGLENVDLFVDPSWIGKRPDLLEVYPYQMHLRNYVRVFRSQYLRERGRL
jgi:hypothetical protein